MSISVTKNRYSTIKNNYAENEVHDFFSYPYIIVPVYKHDHKILSTSPLLQLCSLNTHTLGDNTPPFQSSARWKEKSMHQDLVVIIMQSGTLQV